METVRLLDDFARVLQETAERTSSTGSGDDTMYYAGEDGLRDAAPSLPQILNPRAWSKRSSSESKWRWLRPWSSRGDRKTPPMRLALVIGVLTLAVLGTINGLVGYQAESLLNAGLSNVTSAAPLPAPMVEPVRSNVAQGEPVEARETTTADAHSAATPPAELSHVATTVDAEAGAIQLAAELIASGKISAAREQLTRAAATGNAAARFALAETYDPNMLAAWGRLEPVADVRIARALYKQALAGGDTRAQRRIDALSSDN